MLFYREYCLHVADSGAIMPQVSVWRTYTLTKMKFTKNTSGVILIVKCRLQHC